MYFTRYGKSKIFLLYPNSSSKTNLIRGFKWHNYGEFVKLTLEINALMAIKHE